MSKERFPFMEKGKMRRVAIVCHRNADVDAYLSAYALAKLVRALNRRAKVVIVTPDGMSTLAEKTSRFFPHGLVKESEQDYDLYVAVDVGHTELLKSWFEKMKHSDGKKVLVDHHPLSDASLYDHRVVDPTATSAAEVVYSIYRQLHVPVGHRTAQALLTAMMFDSQHLGIVGKHGLKAAVELTEMGASLESARRMLRSHPDYGEVVAKLKGAQRVTIFRLGEWVLVTSLVGSFQAPVARALVGLGADIAAVSGESEKETRTSLRSTARFNDSTEVHLGTQVAGPAAEELHGFGGGHPTAASFTSTQGEDEANRTCVKLLSKLLGVEPLEIT